MDDLFKKLGDMFNPQNTDSEMQKLAKFMDEQMAKAQESTQKYKINSMLLDADIEPMDEENVCDHCQAPCAGTYCSDNCKKYDLE